MPCNASYFTFTLTHSFSVDELTVASEATNLKSADKVAWRL